MKFQNLHLWAKERFPLFNVFAAGMTYFATALCLQKLTGEPSHLTLLDVGGWLIFTFHLLILRVLDEHKDQESDRLYHPERVLQRGLMDLPTLRVVGGLAFALVMILTAWQAQFAKDLWIGFLLSYLWTLLMTVEFFAKNFLRPRVFLYSVSHLLISPFLVWWTGIWAIQKFPPSDVIWLMGCSFFAGLTYEVARKSKGAEEDNAHEPSYSNTYSKMFYLSLMFILGLALETCKLVLVQKLMPSFLIGSSVLGILVILISYFALKAFAKKSTAKARKLNEGVFALMGLEVFVTLIFIGFSR